MPSSSHRSCLWFPVLALAAACSTPDTRSAESARMDTATAVANTRAGATPAIITADLTKFASGGLDALIGTETK